MRCTYVFHDKNTKYDMPVIDPNFYMLLFPLRMQIGRLELDLPALSEAVEACGGLRCMLDDKKKWSRVADMLNMPGRLRVGTLEIALLKTPKM